MSGQKVCPQCGSEYELDQRFCPKDGTTLKMQGGGLADMVGSIIADRYHILKKLGEGGMGTVYLAEHVKMGRKSAVKVMNPGMMTDADAISRFNREAQNASRINHANVAAVYDFGETGEGMTYLAMEFIEGPSLTKVIEENGSLPPLRAADITRQASEALAVAHDMGIVHRDLKPDNIMLAKGREGVDIVKVVDFGIAKAAHEEGQKVTKTGMVVGTPEYMSPEQLAGDKLDGRSDTYSLALVSFNMLTGKLPFPGETAQESMIARLTDVPKQLAEMKPSVPWTEEVQSVMDRALARDAVDRYQTAAEFGRDLFAAVQAMPATEDLTQAHTAVIAPVSVAKTAAEPRAKAVPKTRIGSATPAAAPAVPPPAEQSKTGLYAGIGGGVALVAGLVFVAMKFAGGGNGAVQTNQPLDGKAPNANPPAAQTVVINWDSAFAKLDSMTDVTEGTATSATVALAKLDSLQPAAAADTVKRVRVIFLKAKAHFVRSLLSDDNATQKSELTAGCSLLMNNEGLATKASAVLEKQFSFFLRGDKTQKPPVPAMCP
jgi:predicted Ser/Thr protein kinase